MPIPSLVPAVLACLDLRARGEAYGDPAASENRERIHRILSYARP